MVVTKTFTSGTIRSYQLYLLLWTSIGLIWGVKFKNINRILFCWYMIAYLQCHSFDIKKKKKNERKKRCHSAVVFSTVASQQEAMVFCVEFLSQSINMHGVMLMGDSKLTVGANVSVNGCLSGYV